ncbi:MAG TPA: hypothetical protein VEA99_09535 [Gemmatimonadaceae bacterium]|nr:hypothetical protein [Gemmatimonadaceae bacterium]
MWSRALSVGAGLALGALACGRGASNTPPGQTPEQRQRQLGEAARAVVLCQTRDTTLLRQLGAPTRDGLLHRSRVLSWISPDESRTRYVAVLLDSAGVVVDLYWDVPTQVPWVPTSQCGGAGAVGGGVG